MNLPLCYRTLDSADSTNFAIIGKFLDEIKFNNAGENTMVLLNENIEEVTGSWITSLDRLLTYSLVHRKMIMEKIHVLKRRRLLLTAPAAS